MNEDSDSDDLSEDEASSEQPSDTAGVSSAKATSARRLKFVIFTLMLLAAALVLVAAMRFWLAPGTPLLLFAILGVCPIFFWTLIGAFVFDPSKTSDAIVRRSSPPLRERLRMAMVPVAVSALVAGLLVASWWLPSVRAVLASGLASQRYVVAAEGALKDPSVDVRLAACEGLSAQGVDASVELLHSLRDVDERVVTCALNALPAYTVAPPSLGGIATAWSSELMAGEGLSGDRACMLSDRLRVADRKGFNRASMQLMSCALDATDAPARECCAQSFRALLGGQDVEPAMVMLPPEQLVLSGFAPTIPSLLLATHDDDPQWDMRRVAMQLGTPSSRAWSMAIACEALQVGGAQVRTPLSEAMAAAVSSDSCVIGPADEKTVRLWNAVCDDLYTPERITNATGEESDVFCNAISGTLVVDASTNARQHVQHALRRAKAPESRANLMRALLTYGGKMAGAVLDGDGPSDPISMLSQLQQTGAKSDTNPLQMLLDVAGGRDVAGLAGDAGADDPVGELMQMMVEQARGAVDYPLAQPRGAKAKAKAKAVPYHQQLIQQSLGVPDVVDLDDGDALD